MAVLVRRLREGVTYEQFREAWLPEHGFGTEVRVLNALNVEDPREIVSVGLTPGSVSRMIDRLDALLLLMTLIWGTNYSIVKSAFAEVAPQAFNAMRMSIASSVFLVLILAIRRWSFESADTAADENTPIASVFRTSAPLTRRDWLALAALGIVGHALYQYPFIGGLARTSVANSSLLLAATPVVIAFLSAILGQDRIGVVRAVAVDPGDRFVEPADHRDRGDGVEIFGVPIGVGSGDDARVEGLRFGVAAQLAIAREGCGEGGHEGRRDGAVDKHALRRAADAGAPQLGVADDGQRLGLIGIADIGGAECHAFRQAFGRIAAAHDNLCARAHQRLGHGPAKPTRAPGDNGHLP